MDAKNTIFIDESSTCSSNEKLWAEIETKLSNTKGISSRIFAAHQRAVRNWLTRYQSKGSNLEKVRGYLEAFYHLGTINAEIVK